MLKLVDITKEYKVDEESVLALHGVDIEFRKNEFVSILGPSGCGKTTLLNIIGGLDRYTSGDIQVDNISTKKFDDVDWDTYRNRKIGFVFQSYNLIPHLTVLKNVSMSLTLAGISKEECKQRAMEALRKVGLDDQARKKPNQLSGGQMQRVAIARALVNNPEIILADEPTGALDSESGIQVMDLLKEVAEDRLVIMVTHNPLLAEEYSTRIVYLKDGEVVGDTKPYDSCTEMRESCETEDFVIEEDEAHANKKCCTNKKNKKCGRLSRYLAKSREQDKSSMKINTAVSLSFTNLLSKKGRTFLTSLAGSIGIIGIVLVLSLSAGVENYVQTIEENALSQYPITINEASFDISSALSALMGDNNKRPDYPKGDTVFTQGVLSNILANIDQMGGKNDLPSLKEYLDDNFTEDLGQVKYDYGTSFNVYSKNLTEQTDYMKVHPFKDAMSGMLDQMGDIAGAIGGIKDQLEQYAYMLDAWDEISASKTLLNQQYDILGGSWPNEADEIVIVLDKKNQINDYALFMLGLISPEEVINAFTTGLTDKVFSVDDLLNLKYTVLPNTAYLFVNDDGDVELPDYSRRNDNSIEFVEDFPADQKIELKVAGVVRPKPGAIITSINSVVGYTHDLTEVMINMAERNNVVSEFKADLESAKEFASGDELTVTINAPYTCYYTDPKDSIKKHIDKGDKINSIALANEILREVGLVDLAQPKSIRIYSSSFNAKDRVVELLNDYAKIEGNTKVFYTDFLEMMMGYVKTMTSTVTGALIGFSAISLIVSTIMIAIIIYTSVLERRKEIGVLRSLGARKKDVSRVFLAESAMIGAYSGIIGLIFSAILSVIGNVVLQTVFHISNLMALTWWHCVLMFCISVLLSMFAGFIPSRMASKKDPAIALRTE